MSYFSEGVPAVESTAALSTRNVAVAMPGMLSTGVQTQLSRMFRDPGVLSKSERTELLAHLKEMVSTHPGMPELRVLLGMTLCVDYDAQSAMEELKQAVDMSPDNFLARLKYGELLMRLRICGRAAEETHQAALLASNPVQSELARCQAAAIRTLLREGIERGGYRGLLSRIVRLWRKPQAADQSPITTVLSVQ